MFALRAGIEALQASSDRLVDALVETGFEMQPVELGQAAPIAAIQFLPVDQAEGHRHRRRAPLRQHQPDRLRHALGQQAEEGSRQVRRLSAYMVGIGVAAVDEIPLGFADLTAFAPLERDAQPRHLLALLAQLLALA